MQERRNREEKGRQNRGFESKTGDTEDTRLKQDAIIEAGSLERKTWKEEEKAESGSEKMKKRQAWSSNSKDENDAQSKI